MNMLTRKNIENFLKSLGTVRTVVRGKHGPAYWSPIPEVDYWKITIDGQTYKLEIQNSKYSKYPWWIYASLDALSPKKKASSFEEVISFFEELPALKAKETQERDAKRLQASTAIVKNYWDNFPAEEAIPGEVTLPQTPWKTQGLIIGDWGVVGGQATAQYGFTDWNVLNIPRGFWIIRHASKMDALKAASALNKTHTEDEMAEVERAFSIRKKPDLPMFENFIRYKSLFESEGAVAVCADRVRDLSREEQERAIEEFYKYAKHSIKFSREMLSFSLNSFKKSVMESAAIQRH